MTKLMAKNAELPPYLVKRPTVEVSVVVVAHAVVSCVTTFSDTYDYQTGYESFVSSVKVGNERVFKEYSQLTNFLSFKKLK